MEEKLVAISTRDGIALKWKWLAVFLVFFVSTATLVGIKSYSGGYRSSIDYIKDVEYTNSILVDSVADLRAKNERILSQMQSLSEKLDACNGSIERIKIVIASYENN